MGFVGSGRFEEELERVERSSGRLGFLYFPSGREVVLTRRIARGLLCALAALSVLPLFAAEAVINADFELGKPDNLDLTGTAMIYQDTNCGGQSLMLTQGLNNQAGFAWFTDQFDLTKKRVEIEFDLFIGLGTNPPADGMSVVFQFDGVLDAAGDGGGGGSGNELVLPRFDSIPRAARFPIRLVTRHGA